MAANEIVLKVNGNSSQLLANIKELDRRVSLLSQSTKASTTALAAQAKQQAATAQAVKKPTAGPAYHQNLAAEKATALSKTLQEAEKTFLSLQTATDAALKKTLGETLKQQLEQAEQMQKEMTREASRATGNIRDLLHSGLTDLADNTDLNLEKLPEAAKSAGCAMGDFFKQVLISGQSASTALADLRKTLVGIAEETSKAILPEAIGPLFVGLGSKLADRMTNEDSDAKGAGGGLLGDNSGQSIRERIGEFFSDLNTDEMGAKAWEDYLSFVQTDIPKAFGVAGNAVGNFMHDMIFNSQSVGETWKNLGQTMSGIVSKMLTEMAELAMRMLLFGKGEDKKGGILGTVISGLGGLFGGGSGGITVTPLKSAHGNVFSGVGISAYSGSIVTTPTYFGFNRHERFARGAGLMGEAGPEAIMPLVRTASGDLGVRAANGSSSSRPVVNNNIRINADPSLKVEQRETENDSGGMDLEVMVTQIVNKDMNRRGGSINQSMRQAWGLTPHTTRR